MIKTEFTRFLRVLVSMFCLVGSSNSMANAPSTYRYFAYGSNIADSTLKTLRSVYPLDSTAAVVPGYKLRFNIGGFASVERCEDSSVHGVLHTLTSQDFARVGLTEGVPLVYKWQRCLVHPYVGDGDMAGRHAVSETTPVSSWTLVATCPAKYAKDLPTNQIYLDLLVQSGRKWKFDRSYMKDLESTPAFKREGIFRHVVKFAEGIQHARGSSQ